MIETSVNMFYIFIKIINKSVHTRCHMPHHLSSSQLYGLSVNHYSTIFGKHVQHQPKN